MNKIAISLIMLTIVSATFVYGAIGQKPSMNGTDPVCDSQNLTESQMLNKGHSAYHNKNYAEALNWYQRVAAQGNAEAQFWIGYMFDRGYGVLKDYAMAVTWYRMSANQGNALAQFHLAWSYEFGQGTKTDKMEAMVLYRKSADQGYYVAQDRLGYIYEGGIIVNKDYAEALKWYRKAADQGYANAQLHLGDMYWYERGVKKDVSEARKWWEKAAAQGHTKAKNNLNNFLKTSSVSDSSLLSKPVLLTNVNNPKNLIFHNKIYDIESLQYVDYESGLYVDSKSRFNISRSFVTKSFAFLLESDFGTYLMKETDYSNLPIKNIEMFMENAFDVFYNQLGFVKKGESCIDKNIINVYVFSDSKDGALYTLNYQPLGYICIHPDRFKTDSGYYGVIHELAHIFQGAAVNDGGHDMEGAMNEYCAQFCLNSYLDNSWPVKEPYHMNKFLNATHKAFLHPDNKYNSPYVLEYWAQHHGRDIIGRLWHYSEVKDPVSRYKKMMGGMSQNDFTNEIFNAVRRFPTWDLKNSKAYESFRNRHCYEVESIGDGEFIPVAGRYPQGYGYNAIQLVVPQGSARRITVKFTGLKNNLKATNTHWSLMGWKYGLSAYLNNGTTLYSPVYSNDEEEFVYEIPVGTKYLWLVVMGAPKEHYTTNDACNTDEFPWKVRLTGTTVNGISTN